MSAPNLKLVCSEPVGEKACTSCGEVKLLTEFYNTKRNKSGKVAKCIQCWKIDNKKVAARDRADPSRATKRHQRWLSKLKKDGRYNDYLARRRKWNQSDAYLDNYYLKRFGVSFAQVAEMLVAQSGLCANETCMEPIAIGSPGDVSKAVVDHCHTSGEVRALLCIRCNTLLGHIEQNQHIVSGLENYLSKHR